MLFQAIFSMNSSKHFFMACILACCADVQSCESFGLWQYQHGLHQQWCQWAVASRLAG